MNIYAIKDVLLEYFMTPFAGHGDKDVMNSLAAMLNNPEVKNDQVKDAPHHFQLWRLAKVWEDTGEVEPARELLCDCNNLIRPRRPATGPTAGGLREPQSQVPGAHHRTGGAPSASERAPTGTPPAEAGKVPETGPGH